MTAPAPAEDTVDSFLAAMASAGVNMDIKSRGGGHPRADGKLHRASALGKKSKNKDHVWYVLHADDPASGAFGDLALGIEDTWTAKRPSSMTPAEKSALRERMANAAKEREEETARLHAAARAVAAEILARSGKADPAHPYLARKDLAPTPGLRQLREDYRYVIVEGEDKRLARKGSLVVPLYTPAKELASVQLIANDGVKRFLKGTAKAGNYHSIGAPTPTVLIGEGYATCARAHAATGHLTICAFDAGNLESVAKAMRTKFPDATIIILADNDRFTQTGDVNNPGLTKGRAAAEAVGGLISVPLFRDDDDASLKATDLDDLFAIDGLDAVRATIEAATAPNVVDFAAERARREAGDDREAAPIESYDDVFAGGGSDDNDNGDDDRPDWHPLDDFGAPHFRCLGVDCTTYYFQPRKVAQLLDLPASALKSATFMRLAPLEWWQVQYPSKSGKEGGVDWTAALNAVTQACLHRGKFTSTSVVRGRGAWFEGKTPIFHAGRSIYVDGVEKDLADHKSAYVYDEGAPVEIARDPLSTNEARAFLDMCKDLRWASPLSGYMLAGLCVIAPVCGFLKWRPHVWIHGEAGSGKSTVVEKVVTPALGGMALVAKGATTEAGIRSELKSDAKTVVFDESETKDQAAQARMRAVLDFARVAASEGQGGILKGSVSQKSHSFKARSMFVFASIGMQIEGYADDTRITPLALLKPRTDTPAESAASKERYEAWLAKVSDVMRDDFAPRLLSRSIMNLSALRENVRVFTNAMAVHLGDQRLGDQAGPLLAGAWSLNSTKVAEFEQAIEWVRGHDWEGHSAKSAANDLDRFVQTVMTFVVRSNAPEFGTWERSIGELIEIAAFAPEQLDAFDRYADATTEPNRLRAGAIRSLAALGVKVIENDGSHLVWISTAALGLSKKVLRGTEWETTKVSALLAKIPGATRGPTGQNHYFAAGITSGYFEIPIESLIGSRNPR